MGRKRYLAQDIAIFSCPMALLKIKGLLLLSMATVIAPSPGPWVVLRGGASEPTLISVKAGGVGCHRGASAAPGSQEELTAMPGSDSHPSIFPLCSGPPPLSSRPPIVPPPCHCPGPGLRAPLQLSDLFSEGSCFLLAVPRLCPLGIRTVDSWRMATLLTTYSLRIIHHVFPLLTCY